MGVAKSQRLGETYLALRAQKIRIYHFLLAMTASLFAANHPAHAVDSCERSLADSTYNIKRALKLQIIRNSRPFSPDRSEIQSLAQRGIKVDEVLLNALRIPRVAHPYYHPQTGVFSVPTQESFALSLENGDEPLARLRIHLTHERTLNPDLLDIIRSDLTRILHADPQLMLDVLIEANSLPLYNTLLEGLDSAFPNRIHITPSSSELRPWAQDDGKPVTGLPGLVVSGHLSSESLDPETADVYELQAHHILRERGHRIIHAPFIFEGGDIVVGDRHIFVGDKSIDNSISLLRISRGEVVKAMEAFFNKPVIRIGNGDLDQLFYHIHFHTDLLLSVVRNRKTQKEVVLLNSPLKMREAVMILPNARVTPWLNHHSLGTDQIRNAFEISPERRLYSHWQMWVDQTKIRLERAGYEVIEVPGFAISEHLAKSSFHPNMSRYISFTNVVVGKDHVIGPAFDHEEIDRIGQSVYEELGYRYIPIRIAPLLFTMEGGPRCAACAYRSSRRQSPFSFKGDDDF